MRATLISQLAYQVAFSFEPNGLIYVSGHRYINNGKMKLEYCRLNDFLEKEFDNKEVSEKIVYLHEPVRDNMFISTQPSISVFDVEVETREVLTEKIGAEMKKELKKVTNDPLYLMIYYGNVHIINPIREIVICKARRHR